MALIRGASKDITHVIVVMSDIISNVSLLLGFTLFVLGVKLIEVLV